MLTIRKLILEILQEQDVTARQLSERLGLKEKEILEHLTHVQRSVGKKANLIVDPARCLHCDFIFKNRDRLNTPGRCPKCRSENVAPPIFGIRTNSKPMHTTPEDDHDSPD
jgi:transcriptional regulator